MTDLSRGATQPTRGGTALKRLQILAALLCVGAAATVPANAKDRTPADKGNGLSTCEERYLSLYEKADHAGIDVGRNLVDDGLLTKDGIEPITDARACSEARSARGGAESAGAGDCLSIR
jgi:hypothetical protein